MKRTCKLESLCGLGEALKAKKVQALMPALDDAARRTGTQVVSTAGALSRYGTFALWPTSKPYKPESSGTKNLQCGLAIRRDAVFQP